MHRMWIYNYLSLISLPIRGFKNLTSGRCRVEQVLRVMFVFWHTTNQDPDFKGLAIELELGHIIHKPANIMNYSILIIWILMKILYQYLCLVKIYINAFYIILTL